MTFRFHGILAQLAIISSCLALFFGPQPVRAQGIHGVEQQSTAFLTPPRELLQRLRRAEQAIRERRYAEAVAELGELLTDPDEEDYFIQPSFREGTYISLKSQARQMLGNLPRQGRQAYELQFGARAKALLDEAVEQGDVRKLADITRMYFHTKAGYEAALLLGRHYLDRGWPAEAARCFERVQQSPSGVEFEPEVSLLTASTWHYAGRLERAEAALKRLAQVRPDVQVRIGSQNTPLFGPAENAHQWLSSRIGEPLIESLLEDARWIVFRGNATRNAESAGSFPLLSPRWRVPTVNDPHDEQIVQRLKKQYVDQATPAMPALHPLVVGEVVLTRTPERLMAVDFHTAKRIWVFPWDASDDDPYVERGRGAVNTNSPRERELNQRLWEDSPYGQLSSDGKSVFLINGLGFAMPTRRHRIVFGGRLVANPGRPNSYNELVALDLAHQGKLKWIVGGQPNEVNFESDDSLAGAFFLGPPLPLQGRLYALVEINSEIRLVVLEAETGKLVWSQQLAIIEPRRSIMADANRRLAGASPSFADGVLICPTSAGAIVAVDITNRSMLWGYRYKQADVNSRRRASWTYFTAPLRGPGERWTEGSTTIAEQRVLATPVESDEVHCLDLLSGKSVWKRSRGDLLYVACVHEGKAVVVGTHRVTALSLEDGSSAWSGDVSLDAALPSGRGFYSDGHYYLPTTDKRLLRIDLESGKIVDKTKTDEPLGNLVCYQDHVLSQGPIWLKAFYQLKPLREQVEKLLAKNPNDAWALARRGELLLQTGDRSQALSDLRKSYELAPTDGTRRLLCQTVLAALREDFAQHHELAGRFEELMVEPGQRAEYLRLLASGWQKLDEPAKAFRACLALADLKRTSADDLGSSVGEMEQVEDDLQVRRDRWIQSQLFELAQGADAEQRAEMQKILSDRLEKAFQDGSSAALHDFINYFGFHSLAHKARLRLAAMLLASDNLLEAQLLLTQVQKSDDDSLAEAAAAYLAKLWEQAGDYQPSETSIKGAQWPYGRVHVASEKTADSGFNFNSSTGAHPIDLREAAGPAPRDWSFIFNQNQHRLTARDSAGRVVVQLDLQDGSPVPRFYGSDAGVLHAKANGRLLLVSMGFEILAFDLLRNNESAHTSLWSKDVSPLAVGETGSSRRVYSKRLSNPWLSNQSMVYATDQSRRHRIGAIGPVLTSGVCFQRLHEIVCVDPVTGVPIWKRSNLPLGCDLFGNEDRLYVVLPGSEGASNDGAQTALVLRPSDGQELGRRRVPHEAARWAYHQGRILTYKQLDGKLQLSLYDPWTEQTVWGRHFKSGSKGQLVGQDEVAVVQPSGKFCVLSLADGEPVIETTLEPENALLGVFVFRSDDQYLVLMNHPRRYSDPTRRIQPTGYITQAPLVNGRLYAFDRASGEQSWPTPAVIENYSLPLDQPTELPVLVFLRNIRNTGRRAASGTRTGVLCLDRRDGRILLDTSDVPTQTNSFEIMGNPQEKSVTLQLPGKVFKLQFTDEPTPPAPPAQTGSASSLHTAASPTPPTQRAQAEFDPRLQRLRDLFRQRGLPIPPQFREAVPPTP